MKNKKKYLLLTVLLPVQILLVQLLSQYPQVVEQYYSNGIYLYISSFFRQLLGWIPFSIGDVLVIFLGIYFLYTCYNLLKNKFKNIGKKVLAFTAFLSILYGCFYMFWGLNYFREPLAKNLGFNQNQYTTNELETTTLNIITTLNRLHIQITKNDTLKVVVPYTQKEMYTMALEGYQEIAKTYPQLSYKHASIKSSLISLIQSYNGTSGYLNPLTGEAQVNAMIPKTSYPLTTCHEMAHQIGFAAENEANFIGFLAAAANNNLYFKYSAYRFAFIKCYIEIKKRNPKIAKEIWHLISPGILSDFKANNTFWEQFKNPIEPYLKKGYNSYLKANKQAKGIASYDYVVDLLIAYFNTNQPNL
ncbi:DUF3810 domain-containing protein [Tenacibaculum sp. UWU-22]|uniref:DUF3810 domain-containing protein n=1 Tax=Tenacibaculum sp. UWU-22 TaxID=3234187 RepID=UPI0034DB71AC